MSKNLSALLSEADELIQTKLASGVSKTASVVSSDDDIFRLAESVRRMPEESVKEAAVSDDEQYTLTEKIAHAAAIVDVWNNLPSILRINEFEKAAKAKGYSDDQVASYIEKNAAQFQVRSVFSR